jgi:hypothetical protein
MRVALFAQKSGITGRLDCDEARNDERLSNLTVVGLRGPRGIRMSCFTRASNHQERCATRSNDRVRRNAAWPH